MISTRVRHVLQWKLVCHWPRSQKVHSSSSAKSLFGLLVKESNAKNSLLERIEKHCRPDVTARVKEVVAELHELKELDRTSRLEKKTNGEHGQLTSEVLAEIESLEVKFRSDIEPLVLQELTRDQDLLIKTLLLEVSCGVGGQEAMLFAGELFSLYEKYCLFKGWSTSSISCDSSDLGGIRSASVQISGDQCFYELRNEAGVHRVQRTPKTEKTGRVHTSTAAVHVIPVDESQGSGITVDSKDLKMTTKRSSGAGGQHVNKTESAVVITHIPTGITVECQEERHQYINREKAIKKLQQLLTLRERDKVIERYEQTKSTQVVTKDRSEKVRTYNFPQDRITDHRLSENIHDIRSLMDGNDVTKLETIIGLLNEQTRGMALDNLFKELQGSC